MESIIVVCITGAVTLVGVILSNSKSRVVMELKLDSLTEKVEKHSRLIERIYEFAEDEVDAGVDGLAHARDPVVEFHIGHNRITCCRLALQQRQLAFRFVGVAVHLVVALLNAARVGYLGVAEAHDELHVVALGDPEHLPRLGGELA